MTRAITFPQVRTESAHQALAGNVPAQRATIGGSELLVRELPLLRRQGPELLQAVEVSLVRGPGLTVALDCEGRQWSACDLTPGGAA
ncbi:MAG: hypothetical protein J2P38_02365, partial [Candidatus Dormibacteraeota bacterium]|nr:hypothetical protein [Candidatus Dormibacteraeota bacterium]